MQYKKCSVIDAEGFYKDFCRVILSDDGRTEPVDYTLQDGELLIDTNAPTVKARDGFIKPRWDGSTWTEGATAKEIAKWEEEHPRPPLPPSMKTLEEAAAYLSQTAKAVMLLSVDL